MERINQLFEETKGLKTIAKMYRDGKAQIYSLETEIDSLKQERNTLDLSELNSRIGDCEDRLSSITKEVDCNKIMENKCISLGELEKALDTIIDENVCMEKCLEFMRSLVVVFNISAAQAERSFGVATEATGFRVVKVNREIEELFRLSKSRTVHRGLEMGFKSHMKRELGGAVPLEVEAFEAEAGLYAVLPAASAGEDDFSAGAVRKRSFSALKEAFPVTVECILFLLKNSLMQAFTAEGYGKEELARNNERLEGTSFHIANLEEWALDAVMKEAVQASKAKVDAEDLQPMEGRYVSRGYSRLLRLGGLIDDSASERREKARQFYERIVVKFFDCGRVHSPEDAFVLYSDVTDYAKRFPDFTYVDRLALARDDFFYEIVCQSTAVELDLGQPVLQLKAKVKQRQISFNECLERFVGEKTQKFFKVQFFEKLYERFLGWVVGLGRLRGEEVNSIKELAQYLMDISFEVGSEAISSYGKVGSLYECLDSTLEEIIELYEFGGVSLDDVELRKVVEMMFEDSGLREDLISRLR